MLEISAYQWVTLALMLVMLGIAAAAFVVQVLAWRLPKNRPTTVVSIAVNLAVYPGTEFLTIHATNGVPTLEQLTEGIAMDAKTRGQAQRLYDVGLKQYNHYVNNRDGAIKDAQRESAVLADRLSETEIALADDVGRSLDASETAAELEAVRVQYESLGAVAQTYAQQKRLEIYAQRSIARDLETGTPRTDYTSVKGQIAAGNATLRSIMSELPVVWQHLQTINDRVIVPKVAGRPPKRELFHATFFTHDLGVLEDKRAERDGKWLVSNKYDMLAPFQAPVPAYTRRHLNRPPIQTGTEIVIDKDPTSEWDTEFWRQGGYLDQVFLRAKEGRSPDQLRRAYRGRMINRIGWSMAGLLALANIIIAAIKYL